MRTILAQLKQYKKDSILTPLFTALEVIMEVMLPFITALIIDEGIQEGNMRKVYTYGGVMIVMAFISLISGAMAGKYAASASSGLACNLRKGVYDKVQYFYHGSVLHPQYARALSVKPDRVSPSSNISVCFMSVSSKNPPVR